MCSIFTFIYLASIYKALGIQYGAIDDFTLTIIGSCGALANGFSRVVWGALQDKFGFKLLYACILFAQLIVAPTMVYVV